MSRRHAAEKREVLPDAKFGDLVITKFINSLMYAGKKSTAETIVYGALTQVEKKSKADPVKAFHDALDNHCLFGMVVRDFRLADQAGFQQFTELLQR